MIIQVSDYDFERIMSVVGYPVIPLDVILGNGKFISREQLESLFIFPAMQEYFKFFPIVNLQEHSVAGDFSIPFPDEDTYSVLGSNFVLNSFGSAGVTASPFYNAMFINQVGMTGGGGLKWGQKYGTTNDYDNNIAMNMRRAEQQAIIESQRAVKTFVDYTNRVLSGYTTIVGRLIVKWAKWSKDFSVIPFNFNQDVIKLSQANILDYFGSLRQQSAASLPSEVSGDQFVDKAAKLREEVITRWQNFTKPVIMRG